MVELTQGVVQYMVWLLHIRTYVRTYHIIPCVSWTHTQYIHTCVTYVCM